MANLVNRLFRQSLAEKIEIWQQSIEFLPKPVDGNQTTGSANLRLAEYEGQNGNIQIHAGDAEHAPGIRFHEVLHGLKDLGGVELLSFAMVGEFRVEAQSQHFGGHAEKIRQDGSQFPQEPTVEVSDRQQLQQLHRVWTVGLLQPYRLSL